MPKDLSNLTPAKGSTKSKRRRGRGTAAGQGRTSGRGNKGAQSRSGFKRKAGFEGGQMPINRRLPKRGFFNPFREEYQVVNLRDIARLEGVAEITPEVLYANGMVARADKPVKLLGVGEVTAKLTITVAAASKSAIEKVEKAGGKVLLPEPAPKKRGKPVKRDKVVEQSA